MSRQYAETMLRDACGLLRSLASEVERQRQQGTLPPFAAQWHPEYVSGCLSGLRLAAQRIEDTYLTRPGPPRERLRLVINNDAPEQPQGDNT